MTNQTPVPITDSKDVWKRGLFMLLFAIAFSIEQAVLNASWGATTTGNRQRNGGAERPDRRDA